MTDGRRERGDDRARLGRWRLALMGLCSLGLLASVVRGPVGAVRGGSSDFALFYTAARVWAAGGNPYDVVAVSAEWDRVIPGHIWHVRERGPVLLYPPAAFVALAPLAALPFGAAAAVWAGLNTALAGAAVWAVARLAGLRGMAALAFLTGCVWLAPMATCIKYGQTAIVILACVAVGAWLRDRGPLGAGGLLGGVAAAIKPQLGALFVVYELGRGRWKYAAAALAGAGALLGAGAGRMWAAGVPWLASWRGQLHDFPLVGDGDPTTANHVRTQLINLHYPLHSLIDDRGVVRWLVYGVVGLLCAAYFAVDLRRGRDRGEGRGEVVSLAMAATATLLVAYHRSYDAVVLIVPLGAAVRVLSQSGNPASARRAAWAILALLCAFVVPLTGQLQILEDHGRTIAGVQFGVPPGLAASWVWRVVIMPHEVWALVGIAVCLVWTRATVAPAPPDDPATRRST